MDTITITKGKLLKKKVVIVYFEFSSDGNEKAEYDYKAPFPPHADLKKAFDKLSPHIALILEFIPSASLNNISDIDEEQLSKFTATGFTIIDQGNEKEGVILSGQRSLSTGLKHGVNTNIVRFNNESETAYRFIDDLVEVLDLCKSELQEYVSGKHGVDTEDSEPDNQQELPFDGAENSDSSSDQLESGETNDAMENERIKNGVTGAAQKRKKKKAA